MTDSPREFGVDFLRAASILYIVGYWHLIPYTEWLPGYANLYTAALKYVTLATFVFCSGYLLARQPLTLTPRSLWSFYGSRLIRIYPLYLLALILFLIATITAWQKLVEGALLISMFQPPPLPTLWFITMIMLFYLAAPFLILAGDKPAYLLTLGAAGFGLLVVVHHWVHRIDPRLLLYWPVFVTAIGYQRQPAMRAWLKQRGWMLLLLLPLTLWVCRGANEWSLVGIVRALPITLIGALVLFIYAPAIVRPLHTRTIMVLAYSSFGLYLFHRVTFKAAIALYFPAEGWHQALYLLLVVLPLTILIAYAIQAGYDRALTQWQKS